MSYPTTVLIKCPVVDGNPDGCLRINEADFIEGEHELYEPPADEPPADEPPAAEKTRKSR